MKIRILAALFAICFVVALSGCSSEPERGSISKEDGTESNAPAEETTSVSAPVKEGNTYTSPMLNAKITIDEGWTFSSDEEMAQLNQAVIDSVGNDYAKQLENADVLYDMNAISEASGDNISVSFENLGMLYGKVISPETYLNLSVETVEDMLTSMGCENVETSIVKVQFAGNEETAMKVHAEIEGMSIYELCVAKSCGSHMGNVTITTILEDGTDAILAKFVPID